MLREKIIDEVTRILHGPMGGTGEELDKNPMDFYSVGILFPQVIKTKEYADQDISSVGKGTEDKDKEYNPEEAEKTGSIQKDQVSEETEASGITEELELTTKFRPSAAGISVLTEKNASLRFKVTFATYVKKLVDKTGDGDEKTKVVRRQVFRHCPYEFTLISSAGVLELGDLPHRSEGSMVSIDLQEQASLIITTRPYPHQKEMEIKTITLINRNSVISFGRQKNPEDCIYQPVISVTNEIGFQPFEDRSDLNILSGEDLNLKLLYRHYKTYALGHGISVNWESESELVKTVFTEVLPKEKVNGVNLNPPKFKDCTILFIKRLSGQTLDRNYKWASVSDELMAFVNLYTEWIAEQETIINTVIENLKFKEKAKDNLQSCKNLRDRMLRGIEILTSNIEARKSFEDANRAMFMQRVMADFSRHRRIKGRVQHNTAIYDDELPNFELIPYDAASTEIWKDGKLSINSNNYEKPGKLARWRPFQLAFLLSQIEGITDPASDDRDTVDLIWFPTGGGKTEAYLALTAFTIFYRRLYAAKCYRDPDKGAGVSVVMRYTLRLLNKQQFERASILICSCDLIRRLETSSYGNIRISNGIWMGRSMTPNKEEDQRKDYEDYIKNVNKGRQPSSFRSSPPLLSCPCCGNRIVREIEKDEVKGRWGYFRTKSMKGSETGRYLMACTNTKCVFHVTSETLKNNHWKTLPVYEVDETIYQLRPSLLFSTVDKFVQMAWRSECFNLFNIEFSNGQIKRLFPSPELIIQDELHLISSALGTIYGVYEIVIDKLCREAGGKISKIVGATATVRNAEEQSKRLYGRKYFLQFPPPATDADDSFYTVKIRSEDPKNRLYVGFMPSGVTTSTALIRLTSVLLERIPTLPYSNEDLDPYYTLVIYFNALKELGKFRTFLTDDIVAYRMMLANHFNTFVKPFNNHTLSELSSVMTSDDITKGLDKLEKTTLPLGLNPNDDKLIQKLFEAGIRTTSDIKTAKGTLWTTFLSKAFFEEVGLSFSGNGKQDFQTFNNAVSALMQGQSDPVQVAPATNMISVGVDIPRLNTMIVNGQPKTAAEYIQASSRVGREGPGVVFTFLSPTKNRDRSHYEQFKAFHQAYYYHVEATSVTPFSRPALEKVLPTVLIALTRSLFLTGSTGVFNPENSLYTEFIDSIILEIKAKAISIYRTEEADEICETIDSIQRFFTARLSKMGPGRKLAAYTDFMERDPLTGKMVTAIRIPAAVYNAPSQFVESLLVDHLPTMQTLRNVESSSRVSIKSN